MSFENRSIRVAINRLGISGLAERLGVSVTDVGIMLMSKRVSPDMAVKIEAVTDGEVLRHDLRPDLFVAPGTIPPVIDMPSPAVQGPVEVTLDAVTFEAGGGVRVRLSNGSELAGVRSASVASEAPAKVFTVDLSVNTTVPRNLRATPKGAV